MKRAIAVLVTCALLVILISCEIETPQDKVLASLGKYEREQLWTHGEFQDFTDFGMYTYSTVNLENNRFFSAVSESDIEIIYSFIDDFEDWIEVFREGDAECELVVNYSFDRSIIDTKDYFYIDEDDFYPEFGCYDVWLYDSQSGILYYFHNNI